MAPEIISYREYSTEPDVWSMGVVFYELLAGHPPFSDYFMTRMFHSIKKGDYTLNSQIWSHISLEAKDMIKKMMCIDMTQLWTALQLLNHKWISMTDNELASRNIVLTQELLRQMKSRKIVTSSNSKTSAKLSRSQHSAISTRPLSPTVRECKYQRRGSVVITNDEKGQFLFHHETDTAPRSTPNSDATTLLHQFPQNINKVISLSNILSPIHLRKSNKLGDKVNNQINFGTGYER